MAVLGLDKSQFTAGLNSAKGEAQTMGASIGGALSSAIGGALTLGGISMAFNSILTKVADIKSEAIQTGFDTDSIQKFNFELRQMNIEITSGKVGLGKMNELIGQAAAGEEKAVKVFARWGISTAGKTNAEIFAEIQRSIAATTDPAQRVAEAMEIFGRGGRELLPLLTASKEALDGMAAHAPIISKDDIENVNQAKRAIEEIKDTLTVMGAKVIATPIDIGKNSGGWKQTIENFVNVGGGAAGALNVIMGAAMNKAIKEHAANQFDRFEKSEIASGPTQMDKFMGANTGPKDPFDLLTGALQGIVHKASMVKLEPKKESPGEAHRISRMMDLSSMQKIGAYAAAPPGYMEMVRASLSTEKHIASIDKKTIARGTSPTRH
jgi:hypothetical protein